MNTIVTGKPFQSRVRPGIVSMYKPYYFTDGKEEKFISNLMLDGEDSDGFNAPSRERTNLANRIRNLRKNDYKFIEFYCHIREADSPLELIKIAKIQNFTFQRHGQFFAETESGTFVDFHGNFVEYSGAFMFRIYDKRYLEEVKGEFESCKTDIHY